MRSREQEVRLKRSEIDDKRRQVAQIGKMIEEFNRMVSNLDHEIEAEHRRTGIDDHKHYAYSTFARAAIQRRENLQTSIADLQRQLKTGAAALDLAEAELERDQARIDYDGVIARRSNK